MTADTADTIDFLNLMLECERAGCKALARFEHEDPPPALARALPALVSDEARYCAGLTKHITRFGGIPSRRTGEFFDTVIAAEGWAARLDLLVRGQRWVAKRIGERLPGVADSELSAFLTEMHATHLVNVAEAQKLAVLVA
jgi:hypothetical protein